VLGQDERCTSVTATLTFSDGVIRCAVAAVGAKGPFRFTLATDGVTAELLRGT
jgi:hypothetical protein